MPKISLVKAHDVTLNFSQIINYSPHNFISKNCWVNLYNKTHWLPLMLMSLTQKFTWLTSRWTYMSERLPSITLPLQFSGSFFPSKTLAPPRSLKFFSSRLQCCVMSPQGPKAVVFCLAADPIGSREVPGQSRMFQRRSKGRLGALAEQQKTRLQTASHRHGRQKHQLLWKGTLAIINSSPRSRQEHGL